MRSSCTLCGVYVYKTCIVTRTLRCFGVGADDRQRGWTTRGCETYQPAARTMLFVLPFFHSRTYYSGYIALCKDTLDGVFVFGWREAGSLGARERGAVVDNRSISRGENEGRVCSTCCSEHKPPSRFWRNEQRASGPERIKEIRSSFLIETPCVQEHEHLIGQV